MQQVETSARRLMPSARLSATALFAAAFLAACGGGGGNPGACVSGSALTCSGTSSGGTSGSNGGSTSAALPPSSSVANVCTLEGQKQFTRSYLNENYLWYSEVPNLNAASFATVQTYFYSLLTPAKDSTGAYKDRFSFISTKADADSLLTGNNIGYGVRWLTDAQGRTRAAYVEPGSPAALAGVQRGSELVSTATTSPDWSPNAAASITFTFKPTLVSTPQTVTIQSAPVQEDPLPASQTLASSGGRKVQYILFNAHTQGAQDKLVNALTAAKAANVQDVVLDMRYNGGGFLYAALTLGSMLSGPTADNKVFEQLRFNDKRQPETNESTMRFSGAVQFGETQYGAGTTLPRLGLPRVYVLTSAGTCSASESVINALRGVGVQVNLIGQATCGKPYGFSRKDNCDYAYFPIEFQGVNDQGFGDYSNGFAPTCAVADDFEHALGDKAEKLLATALFHIDNGSCPATPLAAPLSATPSPAMSPAPFPMRGKIVLNPKR